MKKRISLLLAMVVIMSLFAGCSMSTEKSLKEIGFYEGIEKGEPKGVSIDEISDVSEVYFFAIAENFKEGERVEFTWYIDGEKYIADSIKLEKDANKNYLYFQVKEKQGLPDGEYTIKIKYDENSKTLESGKLKIENEAVEKTTDNTVGKVTIKKDNKETASKNTERETIIPLGFSDSVEETRQNTKEMLDVQDIFYFVELSNLKEGQEIEHTWYMNGELVYSDTHTLEQDYNGEEFVLALQAEGNFPNGEYMVDFRTPKGNHKSETVTVINSEQDYEFQMNKVIQNYGFVKEFDLTKEPEAPINKITTNDELIYVAIAVGLPKETPIVVSWLDENENVIHSEEMSFDIDIAGNFVHFTYQDKLSAGEYKVTLETMGEKIESPWITIVDSSESLENNEEKTSSITTDSSVSWHYKNEWDGEIEEADMTVSVLGLEKVTDQSILSKYDIPEGTTLCMADVNIKAKNAKFYATGESDEWGYINIMFDGSIAGTEVNGQTFYDTTVDYGFDGCLDDVYFDKYPDEVTIGDKLPQDINVTGKLIVVMVDGFDNYLLVEDSDYEYMRIKLEY